MDIAGTGISADYSISILPGFRPRQVLSLSWQQAADGNWYATDRGSDEDYYECTISIAGLETVINTFIDEMENNRQDGYFTMSNFNTSEYIFGENVDYSGDIDVAIVNWGQKEQRALKAYKQTFTVRNTAVLSFQEGSTYNLTDNISVGYTGWAEPTEVKRFTYDNTYSAINRDCDAGVFEMEGIWTKDNAKNLLNFQRTNRGASFSIGSPAGISYPFGKKRGSVTNAKILEINNMGLYGLHHNRLAVKFAEVI